MNPEEMSDKAQKLFVEGFHCSQAVFTVGAELVEIEAPQVVSALAPFGGGLASTGGICGSLPGALAALGLVMGKKEPRARDHKMIWRLSYSMVRAFDEITSGYGGPDCSDIARVDWKDRDQVIAFRKDPASRRKECLKVIGETAAALGRILQKLDPDAT